MMKHLFIFELKARDGPEFNELTLNVVIIEFCGNPHRFVLLAIHYF